MVRCTLWRRSTKTNTAHTRGRYRLAHKIYRALPILRSRAIYKRHSPRGATHLLNIRIETVPTMYGQDAVMRLFNFDESMLLISIYSVFHPRNVPRSMRLRAIHAIMMLMVGPTGSGKSTTLYGILNALNTSDRKILTLEDPIEYGIGGIAQIPIDTTHAKRLPMATLCFAS